VLSVDLNSVAVKREFLPNDRKTTSTHSIIERPC